MIHIVKLLLLENTFNLPVLAHVAANIVFQFRVHEVAAPDLVTTFLEFPNQM
jgi:hypothetical protein